MVSKEIKEAVVKIDYGLLREVEALISSGNNNIKYSSKKQFINLAVFELLAREKKEKLK